MSDDTTMGDRTSVAARISLQYARYVCVHRTAENAPWGWRDPYFKDRQGFQPAPGALNLRLSKEPS